MNESYILSIFWGEVAPYSLRAGTATCFLQWNTADKKQKKKTKLKGMEGKELMEVRNFRKQCFD